jgi:hypothetical protein
MFEFARYLDGSVDVRIRVECVPTAKDADLPIRLILAGPDDETLTELKYTPARAYDTAGSLARLLSQFMPSRQSWKVAEGLRKAAITVWSTRN